AAARPVLGDDAAAVGLGDAAADREAEPGARAISATGAAVELVENALLLAGRDARATIGDLEAQLVVRDARRDLDRTAGRRVTQRVLDEIGDELTKEHVVDGQER